MSAAVESVPRAGDRWSDEYRLEHCEAFRVDSPGGRLGFVEAVLPSSRTLAVRAGRTESRLLHIGFDDVDWIDAEAELVVLRSTPKQA